MATSQTALNEYHATTVTNVETVIVPYDSFKNAWRRDVWGDERVELVVTPPYSAVETVEARVDTELQDGDSVIDPLDLVGREWQADPRDVVRCQHEYPDDEDAFWDAYWSILRDSLCDETSVIERGACDSLTDLQDVTPHRVAVQVDD